MSLDLGPLCVGALAYPVTLSWLYLHLLNKVLWHLTDTTRLVRCDISYAGWWLYIYRCRCLPLGAGCYFRALGYSLLGCCTSRYKGWWWMWTIAKGMRRCEEHEWASAGASRYNPWVRTCTMRHKGQEPDTPISTNSFVKSINFTLWYILVGVKNGFLKI